MCESMETSGECNKLKAKATKQKVHVWFHSEIDKIIWWATEILLKLLAVIVNFTVKPNMQQYKSSYYINDATNSRQLGIRCLHNAQECSKSVNDLMGMHCWGFWIYDSWLNFFYHEIREKQKTCNIYLPKIAINRFIQG